LPVLQQVLDDTRIQTTQHCKQTAKQPTHKVDQGLSEKQHQQFGTFFIEKEEQKEQKEAVQHP
jgi:hypothetical protein